MTSAFQFKQFETSDQLLSNHTDKCSQVQPHSLNFFVNICGHVNQCSKCVQLKPMKVVSPKAVQIDKLKKQWKCMFLTDFACPLGLHQS